MRILYVCQQCQTCYHHPIIYCHACPGRTAQVRFEDYPDWHSDEPNGWKDSTWKERWAAFLKEHTLKDGGI